MWIFLSILNVLAVLIPFSAWGQAVRAFVDRNPVHLNETVQLVVETKGAAGNASPNLKILEKDFDLLGTSQSMQTSLIHGQSTISRKWVTSLSPRHAGRLHIPAIQVGNDRTTPLILTVLPPGQEHSTGELARDLFWETQIEPKDPYVQGQAVYTVQLFHAVPIQEGRLDDPHLTKGMVQRIGEDASFDTVRNGRRYHVIERRYLITPQQSGTLTIPPVVFNGQIPDSRKPRSLFDDMFGKGPGFLRPDPLGGLLQATKPVRVKSAPLKIEVRGIPAEIGTAAWLPAKNVVLSEKWSGDLSQLHVGDPLTRTITVVGEGLTGSQLPALPLPEMQTAKIYPDQAKTDTHFNGTSPMGKREEKLAIITTVPGTVILPEIRIPWWNIDRDAAQVAVLPARTLTILPGAIPNRPPTAWPGSLTKSGQVETLTGQAPFSSTRGTANSPSHSDGGEDHGENPPAFWPAIAGISALLWIGTGIGWWVDRWKRRRMKKESSLHREPLSLKQARLAVKKACDHHSPTNTKEALIQWGEAQWKSHPPRSLGGLINKLVSQGLADEDACRAMRELDRMLYAPMEGTWDGKLFWKRVGPAMEQKDVFVERPEDLLPPLYAETSSSIG